MTQPLSLFPESELESYTVPKPNQKLFQDVLVVFLSMVQDFYESHRVPGAETAAIQLTEQVRKLWGGLDPYVPRRSWGIKPRFLKEVEEWAAEGLHAVWREAEESRILDVAEGLVNRLWDYYGETATSIYIPKEDPLLKRRIALTLTSENLVDLSRETGLSGKRLQAIRREELPKIRQASRNQRKAS